MLGPNYTAWVLAGGASRRMGKNKALLPWGGTTLLAAIVDQLATCFPHVTIVGKDTSTDRNDKNMNAPVIYDNTPTTSAMVGLHAALSKSKTALNFIAPCDTPFLSTSVIVHMAQFAPNHEAVLLAPQAAHPTAYSPLPGFYQKALTDRLKQSIAQGNFKLQDFLSTCQIQVVPWDGWQRLDQDGKTLVNLNTKEDYRQARQHQSTNQSLSPVGVT